MISQGSARCAGPFERHFVFLFCVLLFVGLATSTEELVSLFSGHMLTGVKVTSELRLLREGVYAVLMFDFFLCLLAARESPLIARANTLFVALAAVWASFCIYYSIVIGIPVPAIVAGLRFLEYLPLGLVVALVWRDAGDRPFVKIGKAVFVFMAIESLLGVVETRLPVHYWGTTFIGARAFGTFTSPNIFGAAMVLCFLFVRAALPGRWQYWAIPIAAFDAFASGSRAAVLSFLLIFVVEWLLRIRDVGVRLTITIVGLLCGPLALRLVSSSAITGRQTDVGNGGYERLGVWSQVITNLDSGTNFIIGWGTGLGSNTVFSIYGYDLPGSYISDNTFLFLVGSFGVVGTLLFAVALVGIAWKLRADALGLSAMMVLLLLLLISQALEVYPVNVLAIGLIGWRMARRPAGAMPRTSSAGAAHLPQSI